MDAVVSGKSPGEQKLKELLAEINSSMDDFANHPAKSVNDRSSAGDAPLHKVAIWGDLTAAAVLLENGADVNAAGEDDDTPLHRAIAGGHPGMIRFLIAHGASPEIANRFGNTPVADAEGSGNSEVIAATGKGPPS
jgi:ankyrin repeat protein